MILKVIATIIWFIIAGLSAGIFLVGLLQGDAYTMQLTFPVLILAILTLTVILNSDDV